MELLFSSVVGIMSAAGIYLLLAKSTIQRLFGIVVLGNAVNLAILVLGGVRSRGAPLIAEGQKVSEASVANPLAQAMVLTAIVIGLAVACFALLLALANQPQRATVRGSSGGRRGNASR